MAAVSEAGPCLCSLGTLLAQGIAGYRVALLPTPWPCVHLQTHAHAPRAEEVGTLPVLFPGDVISPPVRHPAQQFRK